MREKIKYVLTMLIIGLVLLGLGYLFIPTTIGANVDSLQTEFGSTISGSPVGLGIVNKKITKAYSYKAPGYKRIETFPVNGAVFNSSADYFCAQHGTAYGAKRNTILGSAYHKTHTITKHKVDSASTKNEAEIPYLDIDTSAPIYLDQNGSIQKNLSVYDGYRESTETPADTVYTNWVYIPHNVAFDCETRKANIGVRQGKGDFSDGAMAFLLARYKQSDGERASTGYTSDPLQHAVWSWLGQLKPGETNPLLGAAQIFDKYHEDSKNPNVDVKPEDNVGATVSNSTYKVGPFKMSNYVRAENYSFSLDSYTVTSITKAEYEALSDSEKAHYVLVDDDRYEKYTPSNSANAKNLQTEFTNTQGRNGSDSDLRGTIIKAEAILTNESGQTKTIEFPVPEPGSEFYIDFSSAAINGYDELLDIRFTYQKIHASGAGTWYEGLQEAINFNGYSSTSQSGCSYSCPDPGLGGSHHKSRSPGSTDSPWTGTCTHTWCVNCYTYSCGGCESDGGDPPSYSCPGDHHACGGTDSTSHYCTYLCGHRHEDCWDFTWNEPTNGGDYAQDAFSGAGLLSSEQMEYTIRVAVPLKTQMTIYKYITSVDHVGEIGNIFSGNQRRDWTMDQKRNNPVKVERGDLVTYTIEIINDSRFPTRVKVKDVLPEGCEPVYANLVDCSLEEMPDSIKYSQWIEVAPHNKNVYEIKVRPTRPEGVYTNTIEFITTNTSSEHMQYVIWGENSTHGAHRYGSMVNTDANDNTTNLKEKDSDTYEIKEYNVNIEKYIYDVEHNQDNIGISSIDTTLKATDQRSITKGVTEDAKKANPVYAEYGDTITYKIIVYNTTNKYDSKIDYNNAPYWKPDKVYVDIEDTLPKKYSNLDITVSGTTIPGNKSYTISKTDSSTNGGKFTIKNLMIPANGTRTITVTLTVDEYTKGTVETNSVKFIGEMRNINRGTAQTSTVDDKYDVIKNNPIRTETKDYYKINNYNTFVDKYIYTYDEKIQKENNNNSFTNNGIITNNDGTLKTSRMNDSKQYSTLSDGNVNDRVREPNNKDTYKKEHPVSVEKYETIVYAIKITNEATTVNKSLSSGTKPATQVRTTKVTDKMEVGLTQKSVEAVMYNSDGSVCTRYNGDGKVNVNVSAPSAISENGRNYNKYEYTIGNETILNPGEYIIYYVTVEVTESNMYLYDLENRADLTILTNINHTDDNNREVRNPNHDENISKQEETKEYVRMKDLVIAGNVWVDFDRDGFMTDKDVDATKQAYYNVNQDARKKDVIVHLYKSDGTLLRTTKTDQNGLYTFGRDENLNWYGTYNHDTGFSLNTTYQRVDKADNKDENGNYTANSKYVSYYIEYEYDGVIYKSTEFYAGTDGKKHLKDDGSFEQEYLIDSNAAEFTDVREQFNTKYEYISYNVAYDLGFNKTNELVFDKTEHTSQLMEDNSRLMTARSFINVPSNKNDANSTNYLWLYPFGGAQNNEKPETEYLKHINLGLELREDVDIALTKDVYKVKTTIDGEEMEYNYNQNNGLNGDMEATDQNPYLQNYIISKPYGLELYESDYKYRFEQYKAQAVREYKGINGESELNVEVTYRITVDNKAVTDDDTVNYEGKNPPVTDTKLDVKIHEILDLYDKNFVQIQFDENGNMVSVPNPTVGSPNTVVVKNKDDNGFLVDKPIKIAEAWYFKEASEAGAAANGTKYSIENPTEVAAGAKPIYKEDSAGNYVKIDLTLSNISSRGALGTYSEKKNNFEADGYNTVYIRGMENEIIHEGEDLDIYVKYVLDKEALEVGITNENYEETKSSTSSASSNTEEKENGSITTGEESGSTTTTKTTTLERSLKIAENVATDFKNKFGRGTENIAQVNAYSVWYTDGKPTSLVDMDSNAGNIGIKNDSTGVIPGSGGYAESETSADNIDYYEDMTYKTGIELVADATVNTKEIITEKYSKNNIIVEVQNTPDIRRSISGMVWDDSRTETLGEAGETQYIGDGNYNPDKQKNNDGKMNQNVEINYKDGSETEEKDIKVRSARAEFVEIVDIPVRDENGNYVKDANNNNQIHYYEEILSDVTWKQVQHTRTDTDGNYELEGFVPGRYVVRFTYGDTVEENKNSTTYNPDIEAQEDMLIFNGQDYKSTKYTTDLSDTETDVDEIIKQLEVVNKSDARDDEIRRLEVNRFSEVMTNELAEILKGVANGIEEMTPISRANDVDQLKALTENTYMNAETVEFLVKTEKLTQEQTSKYIVRTNVDLGNGTAEDLANEIYYKELEAMQYADNNARDFKIENVDFGVEYRPESQISLLKEIDEMKITTEDGETLADLFFYTEGEGEHATHHLDMEKSVGLDLVQFISNDYTALLSGLATEKLQGFVYLQIDDDILQGSKIEITYKFKAQNNSEVDRITENLDDIRYKENDATINLINAYNGKGVNIIDKDYTASGTARNIIYADTYALDENKDLYRNMKKTITNETDANNKLAGDGGYFGRYVGYAYYTGKDTNLDTIASLKFDKILDYVDTDLEFEQETSDDKLLSKYWRRSTTSELVNHVLAVRDIVEGKTTTEENKADEQNTNNETTENYAIGEDITTNVKLTNTKGIEYKNLVVSVDDRIRDDEYSRNVQTNIEEAQDKYQVNNVDLARFLLPKVTDPDTTNYHYSMGTVYLPVSKVVSAEADTEDMTYENMAEIIQFTTLTGRRTNFATTIGNANVNTTKPDPGKGSEEFVTASFESDTAATETITLTPPTGLMRNRRMIVNTVETARTSIIVVAIVVAVVALVVIVTKVTITKIKKRRYK